MYEMDKKSILQSVIKLGCNCPDNGPRIRELENRMRALDHRLRNLDSRKPKRGPPGDAVSLKESR